MILIGNGPSLDNAIDFLRDVKDKAIIGSIKPKENKPLVIPMIKANNYDWRTKGGKSDNKDDEKVTENGDKNATNLMTEEEFHFLCN